MTDRTPETRELRDALTRCVEADAGLLALGIPLCPSCELLSASLGQIAGARPDLTVEIAALATAEEWADRETLLWPRGIHVSRASIPVLALFRAGEVVATRQGGGPASSIDAWVAEHLGPARFPLTDEITDEEARRLEGVAALRQRHLTARGRMSA